MSSPITPTGVLITAVPALPRVAATVVIAVAVVCAVVVPVMGPVAGLFVTAVLAVFVVLRVLVVVMVMVHMAGHPEMGHVAVGAVPVVNTVGRVAVIAVCIDQRQAVRLGGGPDGDAGKTQYRG